MTPTQLIPLADDLWCFEYDVRLSPGIIFPGRSVVVRQGGDLLIQSPGPIDDALAGELAALGDVKVLFAPNLLHHLWLADARERYPEATLLGAPGLAAKRKDLSFDAEIGETLPGAWGEVLDVHRIEGAPKIHEHALFHRPSGTLVVVDLVFNIESTKGLFTSLVLRMAGVHRRMGQSRVWRFLVQDRAAAATSARRLCALEPRRLVMAHGSVAEGDDLSARLEAGLEWMLSGAAPALAA